MLLEQFTIDWPGPYPELWLFNRGYPQLDFDHTSAALIQFDIHG